MLKVIKLNLLSSNKIIRTFDFDNSINYIKMGNSKGKTSLFLLIDYLLASSTIKLSNDTFAGIECAALFTNHGIFSRMIYNTNYFAFKLRIEDEFQIVSEDYYKNQIENSCLDGVTTDRDAIRFLSDDNISFRTYTLLNFLDEHYLGQIEKNIFSKQMNYEYYRGKYIFDYVFNKENINEINKLKQEIEELSKNSIRSTIEKNIIKNKKDRLQFLFSELGIDFSINKIEKNLNTLNEFEKNLLISTSKIEESNDYYYLWDVLNNINNTIRRLKEKKMSLSNQNEINEKRIILLKSLETLFDNTSRDEITTPIVELIKKCETIGSVVDKSDYDETIAELEKNKRAIQKELLKLKSINNEIDVDSKKRILAEAKVIIEDILSYNGKEIINVEDLIKEKKKRIRELRNSYDSSAEVKVSNLINYYYSSLKNKNYGFIEADYNRNNFRLVFNYKKMSVFGYTTIKNGDAEYDTITMVESMSRQTVIQICTYFAINQFLSREYHLPTISTLFFDNVSKPFENSNKTIIYDLIDLFVKNNPNFNIIVTTDCDEDNNSSCTYYEDGLNPLHQ